MGVITVIFACQSDVVLSSQMAGLRFADHTNINSGFSILLFSEQDLEDTNRAIGQINDASAHTTLT